MFSAPQPHTKSLCDLALQNLQFEASTSSRLQTVKPVALGQKALLVSYLQHGHGYPAILLFTAICALPNFSYDFAFFGMLANLCSAYRVHGETLTCTSQFLFQARHAARPPKRIYLNSRTRRPDLYRSRPLCAGGVCELLSVATCRRPSWCGWSYHQGGVVSASLQPEFRGNVSQSWPRRTDASHPINADNGRRGGGEGGGGGHRAAGTAGASPRRTRPLLFPTQHHRRRRRPPSSSSPAGSFAADASSDAARRLRHSTARLRRLRVDTSRTAQRRRRRTAQWRRRRGRRSDGSPAADVARGGEVCRRVKWRDWHRSRLIRQGESKGMVGRGWGRSLAEWWREMCQGWCHVLMIFGQNRVLAGNVLTYMVCGWE